MIPRLNTTPTAIAAADVLLVQLEVPLETVSHAVAVARAAGVPVIASNRAGSAEKVTDGETGFVVEPRDVAAVQASLRRLLDDPALHARMAAAACRRVREDFCAGKVVPLYEACYQRVLGTPAS